MKDNFSQVAHVFVSNICFKNRFSLCNTLCTSRTGNDKQSLKYNFDRTMSYDNYSPRKTIFINLLTVTEDVR